MKIDTNFNFQAAMDNPDRDADKYSQVLQDYHQMLWSKPLPDGTQFELEKLNKACLLRYTSTTGELLLSSDRAVATFSRWKRLEHITSQIPQKELEQFIDTTETIGGIIIWPSTKIDGKSTINGERGFNRKICDRLDLTIECIRRYYQDEDSPLYDTFNRYAVFFNLFGSFRGYVDFFLFQDFVSSDYGSTILAKPFDGFLSSPVPTSVEEYREYMQKTTELIKARNKRIAKHAAQI